MENTLSSKSTQEQITDLENKKLEAMAVFDGEKEGQLENKINELKKQLETSSENALAIPEYQIKQITDLGGSEEELRLKTKDLEKQIKEKEYEAILNDSAEIGKWIRSEYPDNGITNGIFDWFEFNYPDHEVTHKLEANRKKMEQLKNELNQLESI